MRYPSIDSRHTPAVALAAAIAGILAASAANADNAVNADAPAPAVTALECGHLIDTANGKILGATTIVIEGGRIKEIVNGVQPPAGAKAIDLGTQTCMPGLIDAHTHLTDQTSRSGYVDKFHWNVADYAVR